jgi:hypothetical protein
MMDVPNMKMISKTILKVPRKPETNLDKVLHKHIIDTALITAPYSAQAAIHSTLKISAGALVFHRDMFLDIPIIADLQLLQQQQQALIDKNLMRDNRQHISHDYQPGNEVLLLTYKPNKLDP